MEKHPYAWLSFILFIIVTSFWVLNLFIGIMVNAMQEEHAKAEAEMIHDETQPLVREIKALHADVAALHEDVVKKKGCAPKRAARPKA